MSDQELLLHRLDIIEQRIEDKNSYRVLIRSLIASVLTNIGLIITGVYMIGGMQSDVTTLKNNQDGFATKTELDHTDKTAFDAYNKVFYNKDTRFTTRGGDPVAPNL